MTGDGKKGSGEVVTSVLIQRAEDGGVFDLRINEEEKVTVVMVEHI